MTVRRRGGQQPLASFVPYLGLPAGFANRAQASGPAFAAAVHFLENDRPRRQNYWPALALGFIAQAEDLLAFVGATRVADVYASYPLEESAAGRPVNTMNFVVGDRKFTIRSHYNQALDVIRTDLRREHPSNAAHATQSWPAYPPLVTAIFAATPEERLAIAEWVWAHGVLAAPEHLFATAAARIVRPFEFVLANMKTQGHTPGGALFQALVFGYFRADSPNLTLESHSVNTASSRAGMIGDVAGYRGGEVELASEVKDHDVDEAGVESILGDFLEDLVHAPNATAVVVANSISAEAVEALDKFNVIGLSRSDLRARVTTWDLPKQQEALRGAAYYLSRIQKSATLLAVLTDFLEQNSLDGGLAPVPQAPDPEGTVPDQEEAAAE